MEAITTNDQLILSVKTVMKDAPSVLASNKMSVVKATEAAKAVLDTIEASGMSDALDAECNTLLVKLRKTHAKINEQRSPITQLLSAISKEFTSLEKELDPKSIDGVYYPIQQKRNEWAAYKAEIQRKREEEARRKAELSQERIDVKAQITTLVSGIFNDHLTSQKAALNEMFENITLDTVLEDEEKIKNFSEVYDVNHIRHMAYSVPFRLITQEEYKSINEGVKNQFYPKFKDEYAASIKEYKAELVDRIPSKITELEEMASANEEEQKRLAKEAADRKLAEEKKLADEAAAKKLEDEKRANEQREIATTNSLFETQMEIGAVDNSSTRNGYEIVVKHPLGWMAIFQFWMNKEGISMPLDKFDSKKLSSIKAYCERFAHKYDEKIDNRYIEYKETFTAIARAI